MLSIPGDWGPKPNEIELIMDFKGNICVGESLFLISVASVIRGCLTYLIGNIYDVIML